MQNSLNSKKIAEENTFKAFKNRINGGVNTEEESSDSILTQIAHFIIGLNIISIGGMIIFGILYLISYFIFGYETDYSKIIGCKSGEILPFTCNPYGLKLNVFSTTFLSLAKFFLSLWTLNILPTLLVLFIWIIKKIFQFLVKRFQSKKN